MSWENHQLSEKLFGDLATINDIDKFLRHFYPDTSPDNSNLPHGKQFISVDEMPPLILLEKHAHLYDLFTKMQIMQTGGSENDCLIHSFLTDISLYFRLAIQEKKNLMANDFRRAILPRCTTFMYDETIPTLPLEELSKLDIVTRSKYQKNDEKRNRYGLLLGSRFLDDTVLHRLATHFKVNILVRDLSKDVVRRTVGQHVAVENTFSWEVFAASAEKENEKKASVILIYNTGGNHFEAMCINEANQPIKYVFLYPEFLKQINEEKLLQNEYASLHDVCPFNRTFVINKRTKEMYFVFLEKSAGNEQNNQCDYMIAVKFDKVLAECNNIIQQVPRKLQHYTGFKGLEINGQMSQKLLDLLAQKELFNLMNSVEDYEEVTGKYNDSEEDITKFPKEVFEYAENYFSPKEKRSPKPPAAAKAKTKSKSPEKKPALNALIIHEDGTCDQGTFVKELPKVGETLFYEVEYGQFSTKDKFAYLENYDKLSGQQLYEHFQKHKSSINMFVFPNNKEGINLCRIYSNYLKHVQPKATKTLSPKPQLPPKEVMLLFANGDNFYGHILPPPTNVSPSKLAALGNKRKIEFTNNNNEVTTTEAFYVDITKKGVDSLENMFKDNGVNVIYTDKNAQNRDSALEFQMYKRRLLTTPPPTTTPKLKSIVPPLQHNIFSAAPRSVFSRTFSPRSAFIQSPKSSSVFAPTPKSISSSIKFTQQPTASKPLTLAASKPLTVAASKPLTVAASKPHTVAASKQLTVAASKPLTVAASKPPQTVAAYKKPKFYSVGTIKIGKPTKPKLKTIRRTNRYRNSYRNSYRSRTFSNRYGNRTTNNRTFNNRYQYKTIRRNRGRRYLSFSRSNRRPTTNFNEDDFF